MKKMIPLLLFFGSIFGAQAPIYIAPPTTTYTPPPTKQQFPNNTPEGKELAAMMGTHDTKKSPSHGGTSDIMIISPEMRAKDIQAAIQYLRQRVPTAKPTIHLSNGAIISNIMDVDVMPGGTILIFKISSLKGMQYKVVNIEEVQTLSE
ncbi:MAG: hypothetical protein KDK76_07640 [Chlamydiia bacterium]|nr:hypothetical protein [Chlamydiia bacterium]